MLDRKTNKLTTSRSLFATTLNETIYEIVLFILDQASDAAIAVKQAGYSYGISAVEEAQERLLSTYCKAPETLNGELRLWLEPIRNTMVYGPRARSEKSMFPEPGGVKLDLREKLLLNGNEDS